MPLPRKMERTGPYGKKDTYLGFPLESEVMQIVIVFDYCWRTRFQVLNERADKRSNLTNSDYFSVVIIR